MVLVDELKLGVDSNRWLDLSGTQGLEMVAEFREKKKKGVTMAQHVTRCRQAVYGFILRRSQLYKKMSGDSGPG